MTEAPAQMSLPGVELSATGATVVGPLDRTNLTTALVRMARGVGSARWIVGDLFWAMVAEDDGDAAPAAQLFATLGFDQSWLSTAIDVARQVAPAQRREGLSWGHHDAVSHLEAEDQDGWLTAAIAGSWAVDDLRHALKAAAGADQGRLEGTGGDDGTGPVKVPKVPVAAVRSILAVDPGAWVLWRPASGEVRKYDDRRPG